MHSYASKIYNRCRFCLNEDELNLMPLSIILDEKLTIFDVEEITGIEDLRCENKPYMVCDGCDRKINMCLSFRNTCRKNDLFFEDFFIAIMQSTQDFDESAGVDTVSDNGHAAGVSLLASNSAAKSGMFDDDASLKSYESDDDDCNESNDAEILSDNGDATNVSLSANDAAPQSAIFDDDASKNRNSINDLSDDFTWDKPPSPVEVKDAPHKRRRCVKNAPHKSNGKRVKKYYPKLCTVCGEVVQRSLWNHMKNRHSNETPHACPYCDKKMKEASNLRRHINAVHEKKVVGRCEECDMSFYLQNQHKTHMLIHHGQGLPKKHKCKICSKMFALHSRMRNHLNRVHFPQRKHACPICGKLFLDQQDVNKHQIAHSSERRYGCRLCDKRFKSSYGRKQHEITHTGVTFQCEQCEKSYRYKDLLTFHVKKSHPVSESN